MAMGKEGLPLWPGRERGCLRVGSVNMSGLNALGKRND